MHKLNREFEWDLWIHKIYIEAMNGGPLSVLI